ncbi:hypothetical protein [Synechocystis sp. PCC 7509]|uniref:hypothetical protein n=1 Tax=Synechocystis sp. PCC 7509 TaxID=927677 RepID=UPI0002AC72CA|nr:hypothetical protein [Synechocystis sp. PCC 7509]
MENLQPVQKQEKEIASQPEPQTVSLSERRAFMKLSLLERQQILAKQVEVMSEHYENSPEWRELQAGDIFDY